MDSNFFDKKRPWSRRKDKILKDYLRDYIHTVAKRPGKPICIVDGFAGPGYFTEGHEEGSPIIIAEAIKKADPADRFGMPVPTTAFFVEVDPSLYEKLRANCAGYPFVQTRLGTFLDHLPEIERFVSDGKTLLLYLDPYTVEGLAWSALDRVFSLVHRYQSVEILLNFDADLFARRCIQTLKRKEPPRDPDDEEPTGKDLTIERLNAIVGGQWWEKVIASADGDFPRQVDGIRDGFCEKLRQTFRTVCAHDIKVHYKHAVPKYSMVFASRSDVALEYMNDAMQGARGMEEQETREWSLLIDARPTSVLPDQQELELALLERAPDWIPRRELVRKVMRTLPIGQWTRSHMEQTVNNLVKVKKTMEREDGTMNEKTRVRRKR